MKNRMLVTLCALALTAGVSGCFTMDHEVGAGAQGNTAEVERQWFILWGLVPLNEVDSERMTRGASDYTLQTEWAPLDVVINIFTSFVTIYSRTVTVTR